MSNEATNWAWEQETSTASEKLVLVALADHYNDNSNTAWPGIERLSKRCSLSPRTVLRAIEGLIELGLVKRTRRFQKTNVYELCISDTMTHIEPISDTVSHPYVTPCHPISDTVSPKPLINRNIEPLIKEEEGDDFDNMQKMLSEMTGLLPSGKNDIDAIRRCVEMQVIRKDVAGALQWRKDKLLGPAKSISQLSKGIITNRSIRIQAKNANGKPKPKKSKQKLHQVRLRN